MNKQKVIVSLKNICKSYGDNKVVKNINLDIMEGEFLTLLGSSGCGKTTTLRMIAGFEEITSGDIYIDNELINDVPAYKRPINTAFQSYALFPHLSVYNNIAYGLKVKKVPKEEIHKKVMKMLELVCLTGFENRKPSQLSGGQKQRVSIARALVNSPKVLLLDEPLGALDLKLRKQMQLELKQMQKQLGITFIYVTHDQEEALTMSDRIAVMHHGTIEQLSTPKELYLQPKTRYVAEFIGESNIFEGIVDSKENGTYIVRTESGEIVCRGDCAEKEEMVYVCVRPEKVKVSMLPVKGFSIKAEIREKVFVGNMLKIIAVLPNGDEIKISDMEEVEEQEIGNIIYLWWKPENAVLIKNPNQEMNLKLKKMQGEIQDVESKV